MSIRRLTRHFMMSTGGKRRSRGRCLRLGPRPVASVSRPSSSFRLRTKTIARLCYICRRVRSLLVLDSFPGCRRSFSYCVLGMATNSGLQIPAAVAHLYQMNAAPGGSRASRAANAMPALSSLIRASSSPNLYPRHASLEPCRRPVSPVGKSLDHAIA